MVFLKAGQKSTEIVLNSTVLEQNREQLSNKQFETW